MTYFITGFGNCLSYVPSHVLSGLYFNKHRSLATGIATSGSGLGATIFPIILYHLIEFYGWRGSLYIVAGLNLHLLVFAGLLFPVPKTLLKSFEEENRADNEAVNIKLKESVLGKKTFEECNNVNEIEKESIPLYEIKENHKSCAKVTFSENVHDSKGSDLDVKSDLLDKSEGKPDPRRKQSVSQRLENHFCAIFNLGFIIFFFSNIFWNAGGAIVLIFLPEYMISVGLSKEAAASIFTLVGAGSCIGCVLGGLLGNIKHINRIFLYSLGCIGAGTLILLYPLPALHSQLGQGVLSVIFGLMFGIILGLLVVVTSDLLGTEALGDGFGYLMFANGIGVFAGPPIAGRLSFLAYRTGISVNPTAARRCHLTWGGVRWLASMTSGHLLTSQREFDIIFRQTLGLNIKISSRTKYFLNENADIWRKMDKITHV